MFQVVVGVCVASVLMVAILSACFRRYSFQQIYLPKKSADFGTAGVQQLGERPESLLSELAQLLAMDLLYRRVEPGQEFESRRRDLGHYHSPILGFPAARDQLALFQAIE